MILHGRDDFGIQKSGFLWKHSRNSWKSWKQYYFVLTRLCFICYHRGSNGIQGKNPKHKIELSSITDIELGCSKGRKKPLKQFKVSYGNKGGQQLVLKSDEETVTKEWVELMKDSTLLCSTREKVYSELRRASFKRNVEQNVRDKFSTHRASLKSEHLPMITYLNRTPWDERIRSVDMKHEDLKGQDILMSPMPLSQEKRCYTYNENIVLSTPDISVSEVNEESRRNSLVSNHNGTDAHQLKGHHHLSKSFSSDDIRIASTASNKRINIDRNEQLATERASDFRSQRHAHELNEDNLDDGDSGQGSEEFNNYSDSFDDINTAQVGVILDNTQTSYSSRFQMLRSSRLQWVKDDSVNYSNESAMCFHGDVDDWKTDDRSVCHNAMPPHPVNPSLCSSTFSRSSRKWSSELDLVPEEQELGLFRPRNSGSNFGKANTLQACHNYNSKENRQQVNNNNNRDNLQTRGWNSATLGGTFQHMTQGTDRKSVSTLPRYGVPNDVAYQTMHTNGSRVTDEGIYNHYNKGTTYTYYKGDTSSCRSYNNGQNISAHSDQDRGRFERQNKFYHSLDSTVSKYRSLMTPRDQDDVYLGHHNQRHMSHQVNNYSYRNRAGENCYGISKNEPWNQNGVRQRDIADDGSPAKRTSKGVSCSDRRRTVYYNGNNYRSTHTYHGYEETETNFSGPDDSESEMIVNRHGENGTGSCTGVSRLYKIGKEALPSGCVDNAVYYV